jgi:5-methylcytosine-specific restriction endonuclease McrA
MKRGRIKPISDKQRVDLLKRKRLKEYLFIKQDGLCAECGQKPDWRGLSLHHLLHLSQGGETNEHNCILICGRCHSKYHRIKGA